jgi:galactonate dehydratase
MKITRVQSFAIQPGWLILKVETDEGVVGYGECLPDKAAVQAEAVRSFEHYIIGQDPRRIVHHWQAMYRGAFWRGGPTLTAALSGLEMAMWDIMGKWLGVPVYQLLGGAVRDRIRVYAHAHGPDPAAMAAKAKEAVANGYRAVKSAPLSQTHLVDSRRVIDDAVARVAAVREAVGPEIDVALDFHGRASPMMAVLLEQELRPFNILFIEEPVLPENVEALAKIAPQFKTPIATGERLFTKWAFRELLEKGAASILQPDPCACGGIFEARQIGTMAEVYYAALAPHGPYGPVNLAACLQIAGCTPNFLTQEAADLNRLGGGLLKQPFEVVDGYIELPTGPGLGVEVDEAILQSRPLGPQVDPGRWYHPDDGSVAEW